MEETRAYSGVRLENRMEYFSSEVTEIEIKRERGKPVNSENPSGGKGSVLKADVISAADNSNPKISLWTI